MRFFVLLLFLTSYDLHAFNFGIGFYKPDEKVQNVNGEEASDPYSPYLNIGYDFEISENLKFSPKFGYIKNKVLSDDPYGGHKVETFYLLYDFKKILSADYGLSYRYGLGTFAKRIEGPGGTITVPNGAGTSTAYRPGKQQTTYSGTVNMGLEWMFASGGQTIKSSSLITEIIFYEFLKKEKRYLAFLLGTQFEF